MVGFLNSFKLTYSHLACRYKTQTNNDLDTLGQYTVCGYTYMYMYFIGDTETQRCDISVIGQ